MSGRRIVLLIFVCVWIDELKCSDICKTMERRRRDLALIGPSLVKGVPRTR